MAYSTLNGLNGGRASKKETRRTYQIAWNLEELVGLLERATYLITKFRR